MSSSESLQSKENLTIGVKRFIATGYLQVKKMFTRNNRALGYIIS